MKRKLLIIHGPNLNLLGTRETKIYGTLTLSGVNRKIREFGKKNNITLRFKQSNSEGELIDFIHQNRKWADGIVINPAAYTHYSYAIRDAIASVDLPTVEVHLTDISRREPFRRKSVMKQVCIKQISGLKEKSYTEGIKFLIRHLG